MKKILRVTADTIAGKGGGFRYTAHFEDGTSEVIRKKATRQYDNAFQYSVGVCSGPAADNIARYFTFGKSPLSYAKDKLVKAFTIEMNSTIPAVQEGK